MYLDDFNIDKDWCVVEEAFDLQRVRHNEAVMALGTGYLTVRSSFDEGFSDDQQNIDYDRIPGNVSLEVVPAKKSRWGTFIQLVQGRHPFWHTGIVNLPYFLGLEVEVDGERLDMEKSQISGYKRWLDLREGTLYRTLVWQTAAGKKLNLLFTRYLDPNLKFVAVQQLKIKMLEGDVAIKVRSCIDTDVRTNGYDKFVERNVDKTDEQIIYSDVTANLGDRIVTLCKLSCNVESWFSTSKSQRKISSTAEFSLPANQEAEIFKVSAVMADVYYEKDELLQQGIDLLGRCPQSLSEKLHERHKNQWQSNWQSADILIEATDDAGYNSQLAIRQAIYHLFRARSGDPRALNCAKGTTSEMYLGSVCWDMEIFFQPFYIYTLPQLAKTAPMYRYMMLQGARRSAQSMNYQGARYPWQTDRYGDEVCALFEYADHEIHITADIVIGLWHYYLNTLDKDFLYNCGLEIILETSRYWVSRVNKVKGKAGYQLYGVMGPDEYTPFSNNNAYTNFVVRENLRLAATVSAMCKKEAPKSYRKVCEKLNFQERELILFEKVANGLPLPADNQRHIIWQCDDFDTAYAEIDIAGLWQDKDKLFGFYTTQELRYRSKCLKQSDVIALMGVYTAAFSKEEMQASFDYYTPYTIHDSSNSLCHNTIVAALIDRPDTAYLNWKKSIDIDFGKQPRSAEGIHFANVGGMWQEIVNGFCGMVSALNCDTLTFKPCLPQQFQKIVFPLIWRGQRLQITVTDTTLHVKNLSDQTLAFKVREQIMDVAANNELTVDYQRLTAE